MRYEDNNTTSRFWGNIFTILFIVLFIIIAWFVLDKKNLPPKPSFSGKSYPQLVVEQLDTRHPDSKPFFNSDLIATNSKAVHASSLEILPNGKLIAFWFEGSHEGAPDVKIAQSVFDGQNWESSHFVVSNQILEKDTQRFTKKIGNPVIYLANNGTLHLFVVSVAFGGWSGSSLNHFMSFDSGNSWSRAERLNLSPFFNVSTLDRTSAITLSDGGFYLPVYHELINKYPELLRFDKNGKFISQMRLDSHINLIQPSIMPISANDAFVYLRNHHKNPGALFYQTTTNGGVSWSKPKATNLTNHDSSLVAAAIDTKNYLMVHNIGNRDKLSLAVSTDGVNWRDIYLLENDSGNEFSYPSIRVHDDIVDVLYTWKRQNIKHVRFNKSWLSKTANDINDGENDDK